MNGGVGIGCDAPQQHAEVAGHPGDRAGREQIGGVGEVYGEAVPVRRNVDLQVECHGRAFEFECLVQSGVVTIPADKLEGDLEDRVAARVAAGRELADQLADGMSSCS